MKPGPKYNVKEEARRILAQLQGEHIYQSGRPCRFGHVERYVASKHCAECAKTYHLDNSRRMTTNEMWWERRSNGEDVGGR